MARGLRKLARINEENKAKRDAYDAGGGDFQRALVLKPGETATGRFLEEDESVVYAYTHDLPLKQGQSIADKILCLNQDDEDGVPCYGCEREGVRRSTRLVMNFIRYDEPKLKRGTDGKPIKDQFNNYQFEMETGTDGQPKVVTEPALVIFSTGAGAGGRLAYLESQKGGMTSHVCTIHRTSDNTNPYMIDIAEENKVPPAPWEVEFFKKKVDPLKAITQLGKRSVPAMTYNDMVRAYGGTVATGFAQGSNAQAPSDNIYAQAAQNAGGGGSINLGAFGS